MLDLTWIRYFFHLKHPEVRAAVVDFVPGEAITGEKGEMLALVLNEADKKEGKGHWVCTPDVAEWNLEGVQVAYNGPNSLDLPTKGTMPFVMIIDFPASSQKPVGRMYLPYSAEA